MKRTALILVLLAGCTWSNSLYRARQLAGSAERAERQDRTEEAGSFWGQVAVKAESAYARNPSGKKGGEALWLRGRASARLGDCAAAIPLLEQASGQADDAGWEEYLRLDLARCRAGSVDPASALAALATLTASRDETIRDEARSLAGRALVRAGRWEDALAALSEDETADGRWQRAIAAANLGNARLVIELIEPRIVRVDSFANWQDLLDPLAGFGTPSVDSLLTSLETMPLVSSSRRRGWRLAAATGLADRDPSASTARLQALVAEDQEGAAANDARVALASSRMSTVDDSTSLASALVRVTTLQSGGGAATFIIRPLLRAAEGIMADITAHPAGTPTGDLAFLYQAGVARDSLLAPRLAGWLHAQIEQRWPESPYLVKSMLLRITVEPDSGEAIRGRIAGHPDSPYLRYMAGREGREFAVLEDSLDRYIASRAERRVEQVDSQDALTDFE